MRAGLKGIGVLAGIMMVLSLIYLLAGQIGGAIPANRAWREVEAGVTIYVETNGIHTGVTVPAVAAGIDWRALVPASDLTDPRHARPWLAFGWGERAFYLETPTWADVKLGTVARSAFGSDATLMHVDHVARMRPGADARPVTLTAQEYRRLAAFIRQSFKLRDGRAIRVGSYGPADVFYEATGHYNALRTCNSWTGEALRHAGVRTGAWTPFPWTVMWWFGAPDQ